MRHTIRFFIILSIVLGVVSVFPKNDPYFQFLRAFAKAKKLKLNSEKFDLLFEYDLERLRSLKREAYECIGYQDLEFSMIPIPFDSMDLSSLDQSHFKKEFNRKVNRGIWTRKRFAASDIIQLNDTLGLIGLQWGGGSYLDVIVKDKFKNWVTLCHIGNVIYD